MKSLFDDDARREILDRIPELEPDQRPRWGGFTAPEMVCHCSAGLRQALGELEASEARGPLARWPLNWLVIHVLPWPKGAPTAPEMLELSPDRWEEDVDTLVTLIHRFGERDPEGSWPRSGVFGRISGKSWGVLEYRHLDHHLSQFGV